MLFSIKQNKNSFVVVNRHCFTLYRCSHRLCNKSEKKNNGEKATDKRKYEERKILFKRPPTWK